MITIKITGAWILTMREGEQAFIGDLLLEGDRIVRIGDKLPEEADEVIRADGMLAMPGFVNAHQHTPMSLLRGFSDDLKLMDWLERKMLPAEARMTPEDI